MRLGLSRWGQGHGQAGCVPYGFSAVSTLEKSNVSLQLSVDFLISSTSGCCFLKFGLVLLELALCESVA